MVTGVCTPIFFDFFQIFLNIYEADTFLFFIQFIEKIKKNQKKLFFSINY